MSGNVDPALDMESNSQTIESFNEPCHAGETCRLRSGLNVNCLLEVFSLLDVKDLLQLCKVDTFFKELITKWTIKTKMIRVEPTYEDCTVDSLSDLYKSDMVEHIELLEMFRTFGKSITKLSIFFDSFTILLELIIRYCKPATLTELEWYQNCETITETDQNLLRKSSPFFSNLRKLKIFPPTTEWNQIEWRDLLATVTLSATNLNVLNVEYGGLDITGEWLKSMKNLVELRLEWEEQFPLDDLISCLKMNPKLKVFVIRCNDEDISAISGGLSEWCPDLEYFSEMYGCGSTSGQPYNRFDRAMETRYNFLSAFVHLNRVTLTSYTMCGCDLYYPLKVLATKNIVKLKVFFYIQTIEVDGRSRSEIMRRPPLKFNVLKDVEIETAAFTAEHNTSLQFIFHFVKHLTNLKILCINIPEHYDIEIHNLQFPNNLETLDLVSLLCIKDVKHFMEKINKIRQLDHHQHSLHVAFNEMYRSDVIANYDEQVYTNMTISFRDLDW